jgi:hypothetical protein
MATTNPLSSACDHGTVGRLTHRAPRPLPQLADTYDLPQAANDLQHGTRCRRWTQISSFPSSSSSRASNNRSRQYQPGKVDRAADVRHHGRLARLHGQTVEATGDTNTLADGKARAYALRPPR